MPRYRVRDGATLTHDGQVREAGAIVDLPRAIAQDMSVSYAVEEVDAAGQPVAPTPEDDLARFRTHERVGLLRQYLAAAQRRVAEIQARLDAEEQQLATEVAAFAAAKPKTAPPPAAPVAQVKE